MTLRDIISILLQVGISKDLKYTLELKVNSIKPDPNNFKQIIIDFEDSQIESMQVHL